MEASTDTESAPRRGRPRREIDMARVADVVEQQFAEGGWEGVSIERTAERLDVSRATLYRTVPSKEHLLGILFERLTTELGESVRAVIADESNTPREQLVKLIGLQVDGAVRTRHYLFAFFGSGWLPKEVWERWRVWVRDYEQMWVQAVTKAMEAGELPKDDPVVTTRLLLGMIIWVSRWYRPEQGLEASDIANSVLRLIDSGS